MKHMLGMMIVWTLLAFGGQPAGGDDDADLRRATWTTPSHEEVRRQVEDWLIERDIAAPIADQIRQQWFEPFEETQRLPRLAESLGAVNPEFLRLFELCSEAKNQPEVPVFDFLESDNTLPFERDNLRVYYGRWLAQHQLYNETLEQLESVEPGQVVDPATLLFYKSLAYHRLLLKEKCLPVVDRLLEQEASLPRRYATVAKLVRNDIEPLKPDSLDEVSRLMDSIQVRLGHGRAGKRVRKEEQDVLDKLDKMIKELEDQARSAAASAAQQAGNSKQSSSPMQDSMPAGGKGEGNVDAKDIGQRGGWGDLPAKERQQALQQLGKDFPSHYREVIEEYFRKLAAEGDQR